MGLGVGNGTDSVGTLGTGGAIAATGATDFFLKVLFKKLVNFLKRLGL
jgi:hypothetical protein